MLVVAEIPALMASKMTSKACGQTFEKTKSSPEMAPAASGPCAPTEVAGKKRASKRAARRHEAKRFEARLWRCLQRLPPEGRRTIIAGKLSQPQRLALERWVLQQRQADSALKAASQKRRHVQEESCRPAPKLSGPPKSRTGVTGVQSHQYNGHLRYTTRIRCGPFSVHSRAVSDFASVLRMQQVLRGVKQRFDTLGGGCELHCDRADGRAAARQADDLLDRLRHALLEVHEGGKTAEEWGFGLTASVPSKFWIGKALETPLRPTTADGITACFNAWRRLFEAREVVYNGRMNRFSSLAVRHSSTELQEAWDKLRSTFLEIWAEAGHDTSLVAARLDSRFQTAQQRRPLEAVRKQREEKVRTKTSQISSKSLERQVGVLLQHWTRKEARDQAKASRVSRGRVVATVPRKCAGGC